MAKAERILSMYDRLLEGRTLIKKEEAQRFQVGSRTIQRDIDDIRAHLSERSDTGKELVFDRRKMGYVIKNNRN